MNSSSQFLQIFCGTLLECQHSTNTVYISNNLRRTRSIKNKFDHGTRRVPFTQSQAACGLERIISDVVGPMKEAPMTIEKESERDFLRALLKSPQFGLPEYTADPIVQRRVGRAVAEASTQPHSRLILLRRVNALPKTIREKKFMQR